MLLNVEVGLSKARKVHFFLKMHCFDFKVEKPLLLPFKFNLSKF